MKVMDDSELGERLSRFEVDYDYSGVMSDEDGEEGKIISNLDDFFRRCYVYFKEGGFASIVAKGFVNSLTLLVTICFSSYLIGFVSWHELLQCKDENSCKDDLLDYHDHSNVGWFVILYCVLFGSFWLVSTYWFISGIRGHWDIRQFYLKRLGISTRELQTIEWKSIVDRMIDLQNRDEYPIQINGSDFTHKEVCQRIMRKENYMIGLINERVLPLGTNILEDWYFGKNIELALEICLLDYLFDDRKHEIRRRDLSFQLKKRFQMCGIVCFLLLPFSLGFMIVYSFFKYAVEFHSKRNYLGPRWWSPFAMWEFREYNEMMHIFEKRMVRGIQPGDAFIRQFPSPVPTVLAGGVSFVAGALVGVLLLFTLLDESILLHVKLGDKNLFWYLAIFSGLLALSRSFIPSIEYTVFAPHEAMKSVVSHTHFFPNHWKKRIQTFDVREEFETYFANRLWLLFREVICIITTPFILFMVLPKYTDTIEQYIIARTTNIKGLGDVIVYSNLEIIDEPQQQQQQQSSSTEVSNDWLQIAKPKNGKLEKSILNFEIAYDVNLGILEKKMDDSDNFQWIEEETNQIIMP